MGAYDSHLSNLLNNNDLLRSEWVEAYKRILPKDAADFDGALRGYARRAGLKATTTTQVNLAATDLTRRPIIFAYDGGVVVLIALPSALTITGGAGTKYVYGDPTTQNANGIYTGLTLVQSTTAPGSETTARRIYLGQVTWSGSVITALSSAEPIIGETDRQSYYYIGTAAPSPAFTGDLWFDTTENRLKTYVGAAFRPPGVVAASAGETTTATGAAVDLVSFTGLSIPKDKVIHVEFAARKTAGAAAAPLIGLKVNGTQVVTNFAIFSATNQAEYGFGYRSARSPGGFTVFPHDATWLRATEGLFVDITNAVNRTPATRGGDADVANATVTAIILTGSSANAAVTLAVKDVIVSVEGI
jgi:hypothetical protein